jgi:hypothetical protein
MSLQERLDQRKAEFKASAPKEALEIMNNATESLKNSGVVANALKEGDTLPEFTLPDQGGNEVSSSALLEKGPLIVSVYRGVW